MRKIYKLLPLVIVQWLARVYCERMEINGVKWVMAFKDVLILENPYGRGGVK